LRNFLYRLIAVIIGGLVAFGLAEIAVRVLSPQETGPPRFAFHPELGEIPVPRQQGRQRHPGGYDFTFSNNSQGFRGGREFGARQPGAFRVLLLGDSFAYGLGVNDDQTFAIQLEHLLREHHPAAEVINAGCPGKGTDYALKLFQTAGVQLQPEVTILGFFPNDFQDNARGDYYQIGSDGSLLDKPLDRTQSGIKTFLFNFPGYSWLISWSQAANLVKQTAVHYLVKADRERGEDAAAGLVISYGYDGAGFSNEANRRLTEIYLDHLQSAVSRTRGDLLIFYVPLASEVEAYRQKQEISRDEKALGEFIQRRGRTLHSLTPVLAASGEPLTALYYAEGHWTAQTHLLVGRYLASNIEAMLGKKPAQLPHR
jgi:hypothetical protein